MHILYIHQYFITPGQQGGTRSYEFTRYLTRQGHQVTMITSGLSNPEYPVAEGKLFSEADCQGIKVVSIRAGYNDARAGTHYNGYQRMLEFRRFSHTAIEVGKQLPKPDMVFATHTPLNVGITGAALKKHFGVPFVFEVRDLWPDALINIGALRNPLGILYLRLMERKCYRNADHIIALSPGMKQGVCKQGIADAKVTVIPNSSDLQLFRPDLDGSEHRQRLGIGDRFAAMYFGAMGVANGLDYVLDAAEVLQQRGEKRVVFVLHGAGGQRQMLEQSAKQRRLDNVIFSDPLPRKADLATLVAGCDAAMTIYRATREVTWSPNKMFDALSAGKPVLINVGQWLGETIENNHCGRHVEAENPQSLADAVVAMANDPAGCAEMSRNARALAEREFDREKLAARLEGVFKRLVP